VGFGFYTNSTQINTKPNKESNLFPTGIQPHITETVKEKGNKLYNALIQHEQNKQNHPSFIKPYLNYVRILILFVSKLGSTNKETFFTIITFR
jgi:hypothetical protein